MDKRDFKVVKVENIEDFKDGDGMKDIQVTPPNHLLPKAKTLYENLYREIKKMGYLKYVDQANLEMYCTTYAMYLGAEEKVKEYGAYLCAEDGTPVKRSPAAIQMSTAIKDLKSLGFSLGFSFDSGMREIKIKEPPKKNKKTPLQEVNFGAEV